MYWIPKYIFMRGDKPLSILRFMSPQFKALANSQDLIGWKASQKVTYQHTSMQYRLSTSQCQADI